MKDETEKRGGSRITYKDSGVDIDAGEALIARIAPAAKATARRGADAALGGFGGLFDLDAAGFRDPLLVAATDGVGTKLKLAIESGRYDTIGQDLVAMCVNDIVVQGAEPLFFLDYYATGALDVAAAGAVIEGVARACKDVGCALIGGETAEMPGLYAPGDFDIAGFAVGAVERSAVLPNMHAMREGDCLIGIESSGIHSNGYSLVRKVLAAEGMALSDGAPFGNGTLADVLLTPTRLYVKGALEAIHAGGVKGLAHITGGGITENLPRILPHGLHAEIDRTAWTCPPVFAWLAQGAGLADEEMLRTFNCGIGLIAVVEAAKTGAIIEAFQGVGERAYRIGTLVRGTGAPAVAYRGSLGR